MADDSVVKRRRIWLANHSVRGWGRVQTPFFSAVTLLINNHGPHIYEKFFGLNKLRLAETYLVLGGIKGINCYWR